MFSPAKIDSVEGFIAAAPEEFAYINDAIGKVKYELLGHDDDLMSYLVTVHEPYKDKYVKRIIPKYSAILFIFKRPCAKHESLQKFFKLDQPEQVIAMHEGFIGKYFREYKTDWVLNGLEKFGFEPYATFWAS